MNPESTIVLPVDVQLLNTDSLPADIRAQTGAQAGDFTVTRRGRRGGSKLIDAHTAQLIEQFRTPATIIDAVLAHCAVQGGDPEQTLEDAYPALKSLMASHYLVASDSHHVQPLSPSYARGDDVGGFEIIECVRLIEDSEIYRAVDADGRLVAIKVLRRDAEARLTQLTRETAVLQRLKGPAMPGLQGAGIDDGQHWLAIDWIEGDSPSELADRWRHQYGPAARRHLADLGVRILRAFASVCELGFVHGDVHPGNILIAADGSVKLLDFALTRALDESDPLHDAPRGAVAWYWEPEFAQAILDDRNWPMTTAESEQYALAVLVDWLLTNTFYIDFSADQERIYEQVLTDTSRSFAERGLSPWPEVESVMRRALSKSPTERYPSIAAFADALEGAGGLRQSANHGRLGQLSEQVLNQILQGGDLHRWGLAAAPKASLNFGAAGIGFALARMSRASGAPYLLAAADAWIYRAAADKDAADAFYDDDEFRRDQLGETSPYHSLCGIYAARALLAGLGYCPELGPDQVHRYMATVELSVENRDLNLGIAGALLGTALLYEWWPLQALREYGDRLATGLTDWLLAEGPMRESRALHFNGIAHGWAGVLYSLLAWSASARAGPAPVVIDRLVELAEAGESDGRIERWRVVPPTYPESRRNTVPFMDGWCHGSAGYVFLWLLAAEALDFDGALDRAHRAAEAAWEGEESIANLCCGLAGRAYAMLSMHRATGSTRWLSRAHELAERAASGEILDRWPMSLYKGRLGLAVLHYDLQAPELARMPFFELERIRAGRA